MSVTEAGARRVRCAVVGLRQGLENVGICLDHPRYELVAVCDRNRRFYDWMVGNERVEDAGDPDAELSGQTRRCPVIREHPNVRSVRYFDDFDRLLEEADIDAVFLYVPDPLHAPMARTALDAGKYVLLTKPLAATVEDAYLIADAARRHPGRFMAGLQFCYSAFARTVLEEVAAGTIGQVRHIYFEHHRAPLHPPHNLKTTEIDGPILKEGCHWLDLLYLFGGKSPFVKVAGMGGRDLNADVQEIDDNGLVLIEYANGVRAFLGYTYYRWKSGSHFSLIGDRGTMRGHFGHLLIENDEQRREVEIPGMHGHAGYEEMHDRFAEMVLDGVEPHSGWETSLENFLVSKAAQQAVIESREVTRAEIERRA